MWAWDLGFRIQSPYPNSLKAFRPQPSPCDWTGNLALRKFGSFPKLGGPQYRPPKYYSPYYGDPQRGTPNFGKPPEAATSCVRNRPAGNISAHVACFSLQGSCRAPASAAQIVNVGSAPGEVQFVESAVLEERSICYPAIQD